MPLNIERSAREILACDQFVEDFLALHARLDVARASIGAETDPTDWLQAESRPVFDAFDRLADLVSGHWRDQVMVRARRVLDRAQDVPGGTSTNGSAA